MRTISGAGAALICAGSPSVSAAIAQSLAAFGEPALAYAAARRIRIVALSRAERYRDASPSLRRLGVDVDAWPVPPAGLFVVEERTVYLRSASPMTVAHEFAHGLDCALGGGVYRSGYDGTIRPRSRTHARSSRRTRRPVSTNISPSACALSSK